MTDRNAKELKDEILKCNSISNSITAYVENMSINELISLHELKNGLGWGINRLLMFELKSRLIDNKVKDSELLAVLLITGG